MQSAAVNFSRDPCVRWRYKANELGLSTYRSMFTLYSQIYPLVWLVSKLDSLLFLSSGYMLIVIASGNKL